METVIVTIDKSGKVMVEAAGLVGAGCEALTAAMRDALGSSGESQRKPEYFAPAANVNQEVQR